MPCACLRDDAIDCARARYGDTDEPCDCICHYADGDDYEPDCDCAPRIVSHQNNPLSDILRDAITKATS